MRIDPAAYGFNVTIGIAARTADQKHIITVSDRRLSFGDDAPAADNALLKDLVICSGWGALFAGNDASYALPVLRHAGWLISSQSKPATLANVRNAMCDAYAHVLDDFVFRTILRKFGFDSLAEFKATSASKLGRKLFWSLSRQIDNANLGHLDFLVYGFDSASKGTHLFHVEHPGYATSLDHIGYFAIGSGCKMAMNSLHLRPLHNLTDEGLVYRLVEAKFSAETADGVGPDTTVFMIGRAEPGAGFLTRQTIDEFRNAWEKWKIEPPPEEVLKRIKKFDYPLF